ncbi:MAG TPA: adenylate/guanylate cyclase domain-containing protein [Actinomycetota bacterium]|nr:adenylate/guanylate cyclase domain-containing protein [Actinomycetota bacterium]
MGAASETEAAEQHVARSPGRPTGTAMSFLTLRFRDPYLEAAYRADHFRNNLVNLRVAHILGAVLMVAWGFAIHGYLPFFDRPFDLTMRYGVFIPLLLLGFGVTYLRGYSRFWEWELLVILFIIMPAWVYYVSRLLTMPPDFGYVGLILMAMFIYTLIRPRFLLVLAIATVPILVYVPYAVVAVQVSGVKTAIAVFYLVSFGGLGVVASHRSERNARLLFLRERQLDRERERSDSLLLNILPKVIVARLKREPEGGRLAEGFEEVSVLFADAVAFTEQAAKTSPEELVEALDELFRRFDDLSDRHGLEKIKTVGDAYMAVAGAPVPHPDHAAAAAEMAMGILEESAGVRWPSGDPIVMRVGLASGPAVAGVIGQRKFAYDLWGDTVNLASRLEEHGEPGRILVSEEMAERLDDRYEFGTPKVMDLKGKGPTTVRFLMGRVGAKVRSPAEA